MTDKNLPIAQTGSRLVKLREKLKARDGVPGYEKNCEALRAEISRLEGNTLKPVIPDGETTSSED